MQVCLPEEKIGQVVITKRDGERYRDARNSGWGGEWPPIST
jgi:ribosomal protein RSM22 (predicted rRNA methylase)